MRIQASSLLSITIPALKQWFAGLAQSIIHMLCEVDVTSYIFFGHLTLPEGLAEPELQVQEVPRDGEWEVVCL